MICVPPSKTSSSKPSAHGYFTTDDATTSRPRSTCTPKPSATGSANSATFTETGSKTPQPCCNSQSHSAPAAGPKCWPLPLASTRRGPGQEGQTELADLDLITIDQHRRIHRLPVDIGAVEAADIDDAELALLPLDSAWRRLTVMSSRKMLLSGWRPADVTGWSSKNREPALGPRVTMSSAEPLGNPSTSHIASPALAGAAASSSPRKSSRKAEVVSTATSSGGPSLSIRLTCCSLLANRHDQLCLTTKRDETNCPENILEFNQSAHHCRPMM